MRLLLIEDDTLLHQQLSEILSDAYVLERAYDGEEGQYLGLESDCDIALVDLGLPKVNGISIIRSWRKSGKQFPVLVLTARGKWQEKVEALEAGADDYLVKPAHPEEIVARLRALMRRSKGFVTNEVTYEAITLNGSNKQITYGGNILELTAYEYKVLEYFVLHATKVLSKAELAKCIYAMNDEKESNTIEVFVRRLREKLDALRPHVRKGHVQIETMRGQGYVLKAK